MVGPELGRLAFVWAAFIVLLSGLLLWVTEPGTAGFVISVVMLCLGVIFIGVIAVLVRVLSK